MLKPVNLALLATLGLALAACGSQQGGGEAGGGGSATANAAADAAPPAFGICKSCHAVEKGKTVIGPSLYGIVGTKAGDVPGYAFSPALKGSGLVWDEATLDKWLENPMKLVPGTRMSYAGQSDPAKRKAIIAYLKTLK
ncbi:c-type cytochrome [Novosphingobium huizhouense]|uniref:c-type cytochrome n=1 Tax=Novosphingobium huizhouense TaxID=2866625 RepID=UPI001CD84BD1|nr:c-type cytochrome [Novosphingobium huizhouense]